MSDKKGKGKNSTAASSVQDFSQKFVESQLELMKNATMSQADAFRNFLGSMQAFTNFGAVFKTNVQKAGRISIPEAERAALGISEGDLVQVVIMPLKRKE
ncbi:MAG TPA: AbrB/MazE/SpoVT family DNA-binding domain-containing protein [Nitrososphaerales archaeon]|nr:AbrB/MazE/SpoVT family DNA-binding domain-containing protein [Nitrososphaerales archaeon]